MSRDVSGHWVTPVQGHGDRLVLADSNFPSASVCGEGRDGPRQVRPITALTTSHGCCCFVFFSG